MLLTVQQDTRTFDFARDTFAFRNELFWEYLIDEKTGRVTTRRNAPPPTYAHRCFVVVRSARQFYFHARFDSKAPAVGESEYRARIREVVKRSDCVPSSEEAKILIPGFGGLREFSAAHEQLLKDLCGGAWQSYVNRRHWRMLFPFTRANQAAEAARLFAEVKRGKAPIVHVVRFPQLTINHALLIYGAERLADRFDFAIYDPNLPEAPSQLVFTNADQTFHLPRNIYWAGGRVDVYETYRA